MLSRARRGPSARPALVGVVVVALLATAGCTPRVNQYDITNATDVVLLWEGDEILPGETEQIGDWRSGCPEETLLTTPQRTQVASLAGPLCHGDEVTVEADDLVDTSATVALENRSAEVLILGIGRGPGYDIHGDLGYHDVTVPAGTDLAVPLMLPPGGCLEEITRLHATARHADDPLRPVGRTALDGDEARTVVHGPQTCDGDVWTIDDAVLAAGSATVTVINETGVDFHVDLYTPGWEARTELAGGQRAALTLGAGHDECVDGWIRAESEREPGLPKLRAELDDPLCDGEWVVTTADLTYLEDGDQVPVLQAGGDVPGTVRRSLEPGGHVYDHVLQRASRNDGLSFGPPHRFAELELASENGFRSSLLEEDLGAAPVYVAVQHVDDVPVSVVQVTATGEFAGLGGYPPEQVEAIAQLGPLEVLLGDGRYDELYAGSSDLTVVRALNAPAVELVGEGDVQVWVLRQAKAQQQEEG